MKIFSKHGIIIIAAVVLVTALTIYQFASPRLHLNNPNIKDETFDLISKIRKAKKQEIEHYFSATREKAHSIQSDQKMLEYFNILASSTGSRAVEFEVDKHYVEQYSNF